RTALTPMVVLLGLLLPALLGGTVFVEKVFSWPGIGYLAVSAISARDYDVVTATVVVGSALVVVGNLLAHRSARWALATIVVLVVAAVIGPRLISYGGAEQLDIVRLKNTPPSWSHWFGT